MTAKSSLLITFSGIDGAGKSTQLTAIAAYLQGRNIPFMMLWTRPGYTNWFNAFKKILRKTSQKNLPPSGNSPQRDRLMQKRVIRKIWLTLALLDLLRVYAFVIRYRLWRGDIVICDRFLPDALIDLRLWFPLDKVEQWWLWQIVSSCTPSPDLTYYLTIPLVESEKRCQLKFEPFPDSAAMRASRYEEYQQLFKNVPAFRVDCTAPLAEVKNLVLETLQQKIANGNG